jgi:predicted ATPase
VSLFVERARAADGDFEITAENAPAVVEICIRLDGLPLALELAAPRVRSLTPAALLRRLDQRLKLLTGGAQDLDERQRTLRATIDWSYRLLLPDEKVRCSPRWAPSTAAAVLRPRRLCATQTVHLDATSSTDSARSSR